MNYLTGCQFIRQSLGVYVVGAIDPAERARVDSHLSGCPECREELASLAGLPALLGRIPLAEAERMAGISAERFISDDEPDSELLSPVLNRIAQQRRVRRWRTLTTAAAAVVVIVGGTVGIVEATHSPAHSTVAWDTVQGTQAGTNVTMAVKYATAAWGTRLDAHVSGVRYGTTCQFWVLGPGGTRWAAGSWKVTSGDWDAWYPSTSAAPFSSVRGFEVTSGAKVLAMVKAD